MSPRKRFFRVAKFFSRMALDFRKEFKLIHKVGFKEAEAIMAPIHEKRATDLYDIAVTYGGVLIKLCQYFSARKDVFPEPYIKILSPLQDNVPPVPYKQIEELLTSEYGDTGKYFKSIERDSFSSASLGQVHKGVLHDGRVVALKILKPGIERLIDIDFSIVYHIFKVMSNFKFFRERGGDMLRVIEEFIRITGDELDFFRETVISERFREYFQGFDYIKIPEVYTEFSTTRVIVMEYVEGDKITNIPEWAARNNNPDIIARRILEVYLEQFLSFGLIHFDPHPGNFLVMDDSTFALVDFGMSGEISDNMIRGLRNALESILQKDYRKFIDALDSLGFIKTGVNKNVLIPVVKFFMDEVLGNVSLDREYFRNINFKDVKEDLIEIIYTNPLTVPVEWAYIAKTLSTLVGIISSFNPDFPAVDILRPYVERLLKGSYKDVASSAFTSLKKTASDLYVLPGRLNSFLDGMESGRLKMKIDPSVLDETVNGFKSFLLKLSFFITGVILALAGYAMIVFNLRQESIMLFIPAGIFILTSIFYRKRTLKDKIRSRF